MRKPNSKFSFDENFWHKCADCKQPWYSMHYLDCNNVCHRPEFPLLKSTANFTNHS